LTRIIFVAGFAALTLILWAGFPTHTYWATPASVITKVYSNSVLASLNARKSIRSQLNEAQSESVSLEWGRNSNYSTTNPRGVKERSGQLSSFLERRNIADLEVGRKTTERRSFSINPNHNGLEEDLDRSSTAERQFELELDKFQEPKSPLKARTSSVTVIGLQRTRSI